MRVCVFVCVCLLTLTVESSNATASSFPSGLTRTHNTSSAIRNVRTCCSRNCRAPSRPTLTLHCVCDAHRHRHRVVMVTDGHTGTNPKSKQHVTSAHRGTGDICVSVCMRLDGSLWASSGVMPCAPPSEHCAALAVRPSVACAHDIPALEAHNANWLCPRTYRGRVCVVIVCVFVCVCVCVCVCVPKPVELPRDQHSNGCWIWQDVYVCHTLNLAQFGKAIWANERYPAAAVCAI